MLSFSNVMCQVHCALAANLDSMYVTNHKELEQPSPVSVLEIPDEDFSVTKSIKLGTEDPLDMILFTSYVTLSFYCS